MLNTKITIGKETFEIYSVRKDVKLYFWNIENSEKQFTSSLSELHQNLGKGTWALT
ncbi:hypothetical protein [Flagellimonas maritima]|nr:hypothetical protein [Allomuricauda aurantiaca]